MMHVLQMSNVEVAVAFEHVMIMQLLKCATLRQGFKSHGWLSAEQVLMHGKEPNRVILL